MKNAPIQIVVLDRGFVYVGRVTRMPTEDRIIIDQAKCIRRYGTDKGLGQLRNGPTKETVLDESGTITAPGRAEIFTIECVEDKWISHFE